MDRDAKPTYVTVSSKGQMVIPASIRDELGIVPGTRISLQVEGGRVILDPQSQAAKLRRIEQMRGYTAGGPSMADALLEERKRERERELSEEGW
ncbi:MAG TPA: AbrB/MazE/SpoVT family DNA-binding domain-containing protein [Terracidiphilus sp.]|nr:AbrB/MazE/SpoVT family DNA-binding domain-containing protein [Terracidiphilus sp.]